PAGKSAFQLPTIRFLNSESGGKAGSSAPVACPAARNEEAIAIAATRKNFTAVSIARLVAFSPAAKPAGTMPLERWRSFHGAVLIQNWVRLSELPPSRAAVSPYRRDSFVSAASVAFFYICPDQSASFF